MMPTREEWKKAVRLRKTRLNLAVRQRTLLRKLRSGRSKFRADAELQTELRRVAALCLKLGEHLFGDLAREAILEVMES